MLRALELMLPQTANDLVLLPIPREARWRLNFRKHVDNRAELPSSTLISGHMLDHHRSQQLSVLQVRRPCTTYSSVTRPRAQSNLIHIS